MKENKGFEIIGNSIKLEDLLDFARKITEKEIAREEEEERKANGENEWARFEPIVRGIARKYAVDNFGVERDDLEQDLWVKVIELADSKGGPEFLDEALVAKCCWNEAVDKYRYHRRRRDTKAAYTEGSEEDGDENQRGQAEDTKVASGSHFQKGEDLLYIKDAIDLFPKGSRERKYVIAKLYMYGEIDDELVVDENMDLPEGDNESDILKTLGYGSHFPSSWGKQKNQMRRKIYEYIGRIPSADTINTESDRLRAIKHRVETIMCESVSYYLYTSVICKDKALKFLGCSEEDLLELFKDSGNPRVIVGRGHESKRFYLMERRERWIKVAEEEGDKLFY